MIEEKDHLNNKKIMIGKEWHQLKGELWLTYGIVMKMKNKISNEKILKKKINQLIIIIKKVNF